MSVFARYPAPVASEGKSNGTSDGQSENLYRPDLALALRLADAADDLTMQRFGAGDLKVDTKPDLTPVSDADRAVEELLRSQVAQTSPTTLCSVRSLGRRVRRNVSGSSTPSTAPRTTSAAFRCGPHSSHCRS